MPSWNIHASLTKEILNENDPASIGIADVNNFKFGNLLPDVYVGYMVKDVSHTLRYIQTHFTNPEHIPIPGSDIFWETYIAPYMSKGGVDSLTLGTWAHLETDATFNRAVRAFNKEHGVEPGNETRIRKQADFHLFGNSLDMDITIEPTEHLFEAAQNFAQYPIKKGDVETSLKAFENVKAKSKAEPMTDRYLLLSRRFMDDTLNAARQNVEKGLATYTREVKAAGFALGSPEQKRAVAENVSDSLKRNRKPIDVGPKPEILFKDNEERASIEYEIARLKEKGLPDYFHTEDPS